MSLIDLSGKVALVTGGSRGIGAATAKLLATAGASVAVTYRARQADAERVIAEINDGVQRTAHGAHAIAIQADVSRREDCDRMVRATVEAFGALDIFVANAGIWPPEEVPLEQMTDEQWRQTLATNLDSVFYGVRAALRAITRNAPAASAAGVGGGRVVIVSSTAGQRGEGFHADYAATKGAVISFVKSVCVEVAPLGITVNAVAPGWVDTEMADPAYAAQGGSGRQKIEASIPLGRVASPEDIAGPIVFLCSDLARHVTGEIVNVNGGSVLCG